MRVLVAVVLLVSVLFAVGTCSAFTKQDSKSNTTPVQTNQNRTGTATKQQTPQPGAAPPQAEAKKPEPPKADQDKEALQRALRRMDQTAANFRTAEADLVWTTYNSVAAQSLTDTGKIYFRRAGGGIEMAVDLVPPSARQIIFRDSKVQVYTPGTNEVHVYDTGAHREEVEAFLVLGFGNSGSELKKTFDVTYVGEEKIGDDRSDKLELVPISASVKQQFPKIDLWIDSDGVSRRQQLFQQDGDYRLADYSTIKLNKGVPKDAFKLKTSGNVKTVTH